MCTTCGCGNGETRIEKRTASLRNHEAFLTEKTPVEHNINKIESFTKVFSNSKLIEVEKSILSKNDHFAELNRKCLIENNVCALNLLSSPGAGKTSLLTRTIESLLSKAPPVTAETNHKQSTIAVIEGDQETSHDAARIRATGVPAIQINTGKGCHLDAHMVGHALEAFDLSKLSTLFIENVGNLVCPAGFDLGEQAKVVILSVTEGEDKPLKYPGMFHVADLLLLNKIDLLPYLAFELDTCIENARKVNPAIEVIKLSAQTGEGMDQWLEWLSRRQYKQAST